MTNPSTSAEDLCIPYAEMQMTSTGQEHRLSEKTICQEHKFILLWQNNNILHNTLSKKQW